MPTKSRPSAARTKPNSPKKPKTPRKPERTAAERAKAKVDDAARLAGDGDFVRAEKLLDQVLRARPKDVAALDVLGFVCFFQGRFAEAQQACERSLAVDPGNAYAHKGWGLCVAKQGRIDDGLASLRRAMELAPAWFDPYWDFLIVCGESRRAKDARPVLALALERFPERRDELDELVRHFRRA